jgi:hypothetical protein
MDSNRISNKRTHFVRAINVVMNGPIDNNHLRDQWNEIYEALYDRAYELYSDMIQIPDVSQENNLKKMIQVYLLSHFNNLFPEDFAINNIHSIIGFVQYLVHHIEAVNNDFDKWITHQININTTPSEDTPIVEEEGGIRPKKTNKWIEFVKAYAKKHKLSYVNALSKASVEYKKQK